MTEVELLLMIWAAVTVPGAVIGWWGVFEKAGLPGWGALVPLYNVYLLVVGVARLSRVWFVLCLVPIIQIIPVFLVNIEVAKRFGRSEAFGIGLSLIGFILYPWLGFGPARYRSETVEAAPATPR